MNRVIKCALLPMFVLAVCVEAMAETPDNHVANFAFGKSGTLQYENLSFWVKADGHKEVVYARDNGKDRIETNAVYLGPEINGSRHYFKVKLETGEVLKIIPEDSFILVVNEKSESRKKFRWEYEGPVNGKGTYCSSCVEEAEAIPFVRKHFSQ